MMKPKGKYRAGCNYSCHEFHPKQVRENRQKNKKNEKKREGKSNDKNIYCSTFLVD